jgi:hypothetical protein
MLPSSQGLPTCLADQSHQPFFSLDCHEKWTTLSGYELYETWLKNSKDLSQDTGHAQALIDRCNSTRYQAISRHCKLPNKLNLTALMCFTDYDTRVCQEGLFLNRQLP